MAGRGGKTEYSSLDTVNEELSKNLADLRQGVVQFITDNKEHVSKNQELMYMADRYLENTTKTLNLFKKNINEDDFATQYESVYKEHGMLLGKIRALRVVLEKKNKKAKIWLNVGGGLFLALLAPFVVASFMVPSPTGFAQAGAPHAGEIVVEKLKKLTELLMGSEEPLETQKILSLAIENRTQVNIEAMKTMKKNLI